MSDLTTFVRDTERFLDPPPFEVMIATRRRGRRRRTTRAVGAVAAAVLALSLGGAALARITGAPRPSEDLSRLVPAWTADEVLASPDAFVVTQLHSRTRPSTLLRVWKRCAAPRPDHDCLGREAIAVTDDAGHRLVTVGAVTGSAQQPDLGDDGLIREVGAGVWYWAHQHPGPYLLSATTTRPVDLTFRERPAAYGFGVSSVECPDRVGLCTLDLSARTVQRLVRPDLADTRWATPTAEGCGLWALAGIGGDLRLVIQQRDGSFATADIPDDGAPAVMAEGGSDCEVAYYQSDAADRYQLVVSLDQGRTWQSRQVPPRQVSGHVESQPRPRVLIPAEWEDLPRSPRALDPPGPLQPL